MAKDDFVVVNSGTNLEEIVKLPSVSAFLDEYVEYLDAYQELVLYDGLSKLTEGIGEVVSGQRPNILLNSDTSGIRKLYESLAGFEKKYPFIERNLTSKALELTEISKYFTEKK